MVGGAAGGGYSQVIPMEEVGMANVIKILQRGTHTHKLAPP